MEIIGHFCYFDQFLWKMGDSKKRYVESANGLISWESFRWMGKLCAISVFDLRENSAVRPFLDT